MFTPRTNQVRTPLRERLPIILPRRDSQDSPWSLYRLLLEDATLENPTVRSLFVQIGVLNLSSLTTANAIGVPQTSVSLTLAMPRGRWLRMHRYRQDLSKLQLPSYPAPLLVLDQGLTILREEKYLKVMKEQKRPWWHFLTQR